jgi:hypothetical protein
MLGITNFYKGNLEHTLATTTKGIMFCVNNLETTDVGEFMQIL